MFRLSERLRESITAYTFISPFFILFAIFGLYPIIFMLYLSFSKWNAIGPMTYNGFSNFKYVLTDSMFWTSFTNTLLINVLGIVPQLICALLLAIVLNSTLLRGKHIFRIIYFIPNITSIVAVTLIFSILFSGEGVGTWIATNFFGIDMEGIAWKEGFWGPKIAIATMVFWRSLGYNVIIYLAGLQSISGDLYEAAKIDGANAIVRLTQLTLPLMKPFIIFSVLMSTIAGLQLFTEPYVYFSQSGSETTPISGITMVIYLYSEAFSYSTNFFGTAAATAVVLLILTILFSLINLLITNRLIGGGK